MLQPYETITSSTMDCTGTSLWAELAGANLQDMIAMFGKPETNDICYKVDVEWILQFTDSQGEDRVFTIYNWKNGPNYDPSLDLEYVYEWNIGFDTRSSPEVQQELFYALTWYMTRKTTTSVRLSPAYSGPLQGVFILPGEF